MRDILQWTAPAPLWHEAAARTDLDEVIALTKRLHQLRQQLNRSADAAA